jgi:hypothetical protein
MRGAGNRSGKAKATGTAWCKHNSGHAKARLACAKTLSNPAARNR